MEWQLDPNQARLECGDWHFSLDHRVPKNGLKVRHGSDELGALLAVIPTPSHTCTIQEAYVRQNDLIVRYEQAGDDQYTFQLNWRKLNCTIPRGIAIELWISVQTSLLDTHPVLDVRSRTPNGLWHALSMRDLSVESSDAVAIGLVKKASVTSLVMVQPSDALQAKRVRNRDEEFTLRMFGEFMERGVIRRARLCYVAAPGDLSRRDIVNQYQLFADSPLPLTA